MHVRLLAESLFEQADLSTQQSHKGAHADDDGGSRRARFGAAGTPLASVTIAGGVIAGHPPSPQFPGRIEIVLGYGIVNEFLHLFDVKMVRHNVIVVKRSQFTGWVLSWPSPRLDAAAVGHVMESVRKPVYA
jgi:hypothetical protein